MAKKADRNKERGIKPAQVASVVTAVAVAGCLLPLSGCKTSKTLTELLFDQNSETVDEQNQSRFLRNILDALDMTEELAQLMERKTNLHRETVEDETIKGDEDSDEEVAQASYDENSASKSQTGESGDGSGESSSDDVGSSQGSSSKNGSKHSNKNGKNKKKAKSGASADGSDGDENNTPVYHGKGGDGKTYGEDGDYEELPDSVQTVVAFGECANMVVSFAGKHALAGADKAFLTNSFIKTAYKSKDIANPKTVNITKAGVIDADKIVSLKPDALLLSGSTYSLSKAGKAALEKAKIDVVYLPAMTKASRITDVAESIGKMFGSDTLSGDDAKAAADAYVEWHDSIVDEASEKEGGIVGSINYDTGASNKGNKGVYTAYIDQWDNATYFASPDGLLSWTDKNGVAISKIGYKWSPMSYYLSVGGTQNLSATFKKDTYTLASPSALCYFWQFNLGRLPTVYKKYWANTTISVSKLSNSGNSSDDLLAKASDGTTLGSSGYPYVITRSQAITKKMNSSKKATKGLYAKYSKVTGTNGDGVGFLSKTGGYCSACISGDFDVHTNPSGLYSGWIDGSPESVLEASWISDINHGTSTVEKNIKAYYKLFYNVTLSNKQVTTILNGKTK